MVGSAITTQMYNRRFLELAEAEIEAQIQEMPAKYTSDTFCEAFADHFPETWERFVALYTARSHDRPHAIQIVHSQLMHTVNSRFTHLTRKVRTVPNPKGGDMSEWVRC
jgi:hypothetical protein